MGEVHATLYQHMGLDPNATTISDLTGRPQCFGGWLEAIAGIDLTELTTT